MNEAIKEKEYGLNRGNLKMIALFCMTLDHFAVAIIDSYAKTIPAGSETLKNLVETLSACVRMFGRVAFPIFCFFIVEGFFHTRNVYKFALRLQLFAFISEIPFDMVLSHGFFSSRGMNVFWTLLLGLVVIYNMEGVDTKFKLPKPAKYTINGIICILSMYVAQHFKFDYGLIGVLTIIVIYLVGKDEYVFATVLNIIGQVAKFIYKKQFDMAHITLAITLFIFFTLLIYMSREIDNKNVKKMIAGVGTLCITNISELGAIFVIPLMRYYNRGKGKNGKWIFYFYYPIHLLLLAFLCMAMKLY